MKQEENYEQQANSLKKGLTVKDLVTTGIFSAIFFVFTLIGGLPFAPNPVLTFYMPMGAALLCGPIYLLMVAKVQKRWSVTILGIIMGIIWFATGMHWAFSLGYIAWGSLRTLWPARVTTATRPSTCCPTC